MGDFLRLSGANDANTIVMNPPYTIADDFVRHGLSVVGDTGTVRALLRLTWIAAKKRADLLPHLAEF